MSKKSYLLAVLTISIGLLGSITLSAQEAKSTKENRKKARIAKRVKQKLLQAEKLDAIKTLVSDTTFIIETTAFRDRNRLTSTLVENNFIKIEGKDVIIQTADPQNSGTNGLGGVTIYGQLTDYKIIETKHGIRLSMQLSSLRLGQTTMILNVSPEGKSNLNMTGPNGLKLFFLGDLKNLENTNHTIGFQRFASSIF